MNEIVNKFLLVGDKFIPQMHLKQMQVLLIKGFINKNEFDKAYFQHDMTYGKSKNFVKRTQSDKVLKDKAFKIANNPKYDDYQRGLA